MQQDDELLGPELEARIAARTEELSTLSTHLLRKTEMERSALAKELHDELGGLITAAKMDMSWLSARLGGALDAESREKLESVMQMLNQAMMLKRRVVENLRPSLLDHFGLAVAMRSHFDENCARAGIECVSTLPDEPLELDVVTQLSLFRVAQEAL
ncbi:MAG TPA: histidine kinase, partial [Steroidobacteraceae bacterium]